MNIVEQLSSAAGMEKKAYFDYVKAYSSSAIAALVKGRVSLEKAASLVKETINSDSRANSLKTNCAVLEKAAEYVASLETKVSELEKFAQATDQEKKIEESTPMSKLANIGFSKEELTYMASLPENLVEKVASIGSKPWEMGSGAGFAREKTDPLLEFILS